MFKKFFVNFLLIILVLNISQPFVLADNNINTTISGAKYITPGAQLVFDATIGTTGSICLPFGTTANWITDSFVKSIVEPRKATKSTGQTAITAILGSEYPDSNVTKVVAFERQAVGGTTNKNQRIDIAAGSIKNDATAIRFWVMGNIFDQSFIPFVFYNTDKATRKYYGTTSETIGTNLNAKSYTSNPPQQGLINDTLWHQVTMSLSAIADKTQITSIGFQCNASGPGNTYYVGNLEVVYNNNPPADLKGWSSIVDNGNSTVTLSWNEPLDPHYDGLEIQDATGNMLITVAKGTKNAVVPGTLADAQNYKGIVWSDVGTHSTGVFDNISPAPVTKITKTEVSDTSTKLSWINPIDRDFSSVKIYNNDTRELLSTSAVGATSCTVNSLVVGTTYNLAVTTIDYSGNESVPVTFKYTKKAQQSINDDEIDDSNSVIIPEYAINNITLPTYGQCGSDITWQTSNANYITVTGEVTRPTSLQNDAQVTLTGTFAKTDGVPLPKSYIVKVPRESLLSNTTLVGNDNLVDLPNIIDSNLNTYWRPGINITTASFTVLNTSNQLFDTVSVYSDNNNITECKILTSNDNTLWQTQTPITNTVTGVIRKIKISGNTSKYIKLEFSGNVSDGVGISVADLDFSLGSDTIVAMDKNAINIGNNLTNLTSDLVLPILGNYGSTISWVSSNPSVIRTDGTVIRGQSNQYATLTATITHGVGDSLATDTKVYEDIMVPAKVVNLPSGGRGTSGGGGSVTYKPVITAIPQPTQLSFNDVPKSYWAYEYIMDLLNRGIVNGVKENLFAPEQNITREEFAKILVSALSLSTDKKTENMSDVPNNAWFAPYVNTITAMGIANGIGDNKFGVGLPITRQDIAVMCDKAISILSLTYGNSSNMQFSDNVLIDDYAKDSVARLSNYDIISGSNNYFNPLNNCTRAQMAKIIVKVIGGKK